MPSRTIQSGAYRGAIDDKWSASDAEIAALGDVGRWVREAEAIPSLGRHALARHSVYLGGREVVVAIKSFSRGSRWRDRYFRKVGSKAERSFLAAERLAGHGVGTPAPIAFLDHWQENRLIASYYLCEFEHEITSFRDELDRLYRDDPLCRRIMDLMATVASAIADMHDAGLCHRDLGNQNILLRRKGDDAWGDVQFIDLNRAHLADQLTVQQRARDISRIDLPSDFLRVFKCMYHRDQHPSDEFNRWEQHYRKRFAFHTATRKYRHPVREARARRAANAGDITPRGRDLWVWDDRSVQAVSTMQSRERHRYYPKSNHFHIARGVITSLAPVYRRYRDLLPGAFKKEVSIKGRLGIAVGTVPGNESKELPLFNAFGAVPALVRLYRHESDAANAATIEYARQLKQSGHSVFAALVQDRACVRDGAKWNAFVRRWLPSLSGVAEWIEVGHAINRVKWGVWDIRDYRTLLEPVLGVARDMGTFKVCGPAVIDFEYHYLAAALQSLPGAGCLDALSHLLYVDRRGAPENMQSGRFSTVEKLALAKAFAAWSGAVKDDRVIVSEVNWPLLDTGAYSPVCSPYVIPNSHTNDPSVDEDTYANYMIRYIALALCSGFADAVYWWRLVAHGFGLVDDSQAAWRCRPAYDSFRTFATRLGNAVFRGAVKSPAGIHAYRFSGTSEDDTVLAWAHPAPMTFSIPFHFDALLDRSGREIMSGGTTVKLTGAPVYFVGVR